MSTKDQDIVFKYVVRLAGGGVFCSTRDGVTGRSKMFLVFKDQEKIYLRNARKETWDELADDQEYQTIWDGFVNAIRNGIPSFSSANLAGI